MCGEQGCERVTPDGEIIRINIERLSYELCSRSTSKCDSYVIDEHRAAGAFDTVRFNGVNFIKISTLTDDLLGLAAGSFIEVRHSMLVSISSGGSCLRN